MNIYHYHATIQESVGMLTNIDGIATAVKPILSLSEYRELKAHIASNNNLDVSKLSITSLTFLGTSAEQQSDSGQ